MSLVRLNIKSRIELETRVLAAALKQSFDRGDSEGASLAHKQLFHLLKDAGKSEPGSIDCIRITDGVLPGASESDVPSESLQMTTAAPGRAAVATMDAGGSDLESNDQAEVVRAKETTGEEAESSLAARLYKQPLFGAYNPGDDAANKDKAGTFRQGFMRNSARLQAAKADKRPAESNSADGNTRDDVAAQMPPGPIETRMKYLPKSAAEAAVRAASESTETEAYSERKMLERQSAALEPTESAAVEPPADEQCSPELQSSEMVSDNPEIAQQREEHDVQVHENVAELEGSEQDNFEPEGAESLPERADEVSEQKLSRPEEGNSSDFELAKEPVEPQEVMAQEISPEISQPQTSESVAPAVQHQSPPAAQQSDKAEEVVEPAEPADTQTTKPAFESDPKHVTPEMIIQAARAPESVPASMAHQMTAELPMISLNLDEIAAASQIVELTAPNVVMSHGGAAAAANAAAASSVPTEAAAPAPEKAADGPGLYGLLAVSQISAFDEIHRNFLRMVKRVLREIKANRAIRYDKLPELQRLWIAHDILTDPVTRTDYDFRALGVRGTADAVTHPAEDQQPVRMGARTPLRIGELLQCAGLLESAELEIACDMHKAMPEVQFGTFLVRQGFIEEHHLDAVLIGQKLLRAGAISVAQFQVAMDDAQTARKPISESLIDLGYMTPIDLDQVLNPPPPEEPPPLTIQIREVPIAPKAVEIKTNEMKAAMPAWKDQLDWGPPEETTTEPSAPAVQPDPAPMKQGLAGLLSGSSAPQLSGKNALPSWTDQLDWAAPEEPATASEVAQSAELASNAPVVAQPKLDSGNALPTWKDQLDWDSPSTTDADTEAVSEPPPAEPENVEPEGEPPEPWLAFMESETEQSQTPASPEVAEPIMSFGHMAHVFGHVSASEANASAEERTAQEKAKPSSTISEQADQPAEQEGGFFAHLAGKPDIFNSSSIMGGTDSGAAESDEDEDITTRSGESPAYVESQEDTGEIVEPEKESEESTEDGTLKDKRRKTKERRKKRR